MAYQIYLKKSEEKRILEGHPWVYANEVSRIDGEGKNGDLASVYSFSGKFLGKGFINHFSKILVRIFIKDENEDFSIDLLKNRLKAANDYRLSLGYKDSYRMVFAEADDLPALIVDKYHDIFSIQILSYGMNLHKKEIVDSLVELFSPRGIYERSDVDVRIKEGLTKTKGVLYGDFDPRVIIEEKGAKMVVDLENGQKTGYFLDQKENRFAIRRYAENKTVLDCFSNVGGFSINAALGGAKKVTAVDISEVALKDVLENAKLNNVENIVDTKCGDVFEILRKYKEENTKFDMVILDPPAFCKTASEINDAYRGYKDINILGLKLVNKGGYLVTASCSHYMTRTLFERMLKDSSKESGIKAQIVEVKTQAPDHPALIGDEESTYLKFYILHVI